MTEVAFDSNIVIDFLSGIPAALAEFRRYSAVSISMVTWIEVMAGASAEQEDSIRATLAGYKTIGLTAEIGERAAVIRRERRIRLPDAIILASAEVRGLVLVTRNERDFSERMPGVRIPYRLNP
jgi:predicted nucleic acid-binding protein